MKSSNYLKRLPAHLFQIKSIACLTLISMIGIITFSLQYIIRFCDKTAIDTSLADFYVYISSSSLLGLFIVPMSVYITMYSCILDFNSMVVVRYPNKKDLWLNQVLRILLFQFFWLIALISAISLEGGIFHIPAVNWSSNSSLFYYINKNTIAIHIESIILYFSTYTYLTLCLFNILSLFLLWITAKRIVIWLVLILILVNEAYGMPVYRSVISIDYSFWESTEKFPLQVFIIIGIIFLLTLVGHICTKEKEFI